MRDDIVYLSFQHALIKHSILCESQTYSKKECKSVLVEHSIKWISQIAKK